MSGGLLLVVVLISASANGAERIRYQEIPARLAPFGTAIRGYSIKMTTLDGDVHKGETASFSATQISLARGGVSRWENIPSGQVARIEIRRGRRAFEFTTGSLIFGAHAACSCGTTRLSLCAEGPGLLAASVASAPITLAADGIQFLIPPKVYEIIH